MCSNMNGNCVSYSICCTDIVSSKKSICPTMAWIDKNRANKTILFVDGFIAHLCFQTLWWNRLCVRFVWELVQLIISSGYDDLPLWILTDSLDTLVNCVVTPCYLITNLISVLCEASEFKMNLGIIIIIFFDPAQSFMSVAEIKMFWLGFDWLILYHWSFFYVFYRNKFANLISALNGFNRNGMS